MFAQAFHLSALPFEENIDAERRETLDLKRVICRPRDDLAVGRANLGHQVCVDEFTERPQRAGACCRKRMCDVHETARDQDAPGYPRREFRGPAHRPVVKTVHRARPRVPGKDRGGDLDDTGPLQLTIHCEPIPNGLQDFR